MSGDEYDKDSVNLWVDPEQKARWEAYLEEETGVQYLSQLIRMAVENEISETGPTDVTIPACLENQLQEVTDTVQQFERNVQRIDERLVAIEQAVRDDPEIRDLANRIFDLLPTHEELTEYEQLVAQAGSRPPETVESAVHSGRVTDIAGHLEETEHRVRQALDKLQQDMHRVHTTQIDDEQRYYKEV